MVLEHSAVDSDIEPRRPYFSSSRIMRMVADAVAVVAGRVARAPSGRAAARAVRCGLIGGAYS
jgi:hypothetical protein